MCDMKNGPNSASNLVEPKHLISQENKKIVLLLFIQMYQGVSLKQKEIFQTSF